MSFVKLLYWFGSSIGARVLTSLGMGFVSFAGVQAAANALITSFSTQWDSMTPVVLNILSLAGFPTAIGWIIGAILAKLSLTSISKLARIPT